MRGRSKPEVPSLPTPHHRLRRSLPQGEALISRTRLPKYLPVEARNLIRGYSPPRIPPREKRHAAYPRQPTLSHVVISSVSREIPCGKNGKPHIRASQMTAVAHCREIPRGGNDNNRTRYAAGRGRPALPTASPRIGHAVISSVSREIPRGKNGKPHIRASQMTAGVPCRASPLARAGSAPRPQGLRALRLLAACLTFFLRGSRFRFSLRQSGSRPKKNPRSWGRYALP